MIEPKTPRQLLVECWKDLQVALRRMDEAAKAFDQDPTEEMDLAWWQALEAAVSAAHRYEGAQALYAQEQREAPELQRQG